MEKKGWVKTRLIDLCDSVEYGLTQAATNMPEGPKFLRITDIVKGIIDWTDVPYCKIEQERAQKYQLQHADIVIARTGASTGYSAYINHPPRAVFASYLIRLKINKRADSRFISYFLKSPQYWKYIESVLGDKSAQPNASAKTLTRVELDLPPLEAQHAIACVLSSLDEKIELNYKINITAEKIAQTFFKHWFIDFEFPTEDGEPYKSSGGAMVDSKFGEMPRGWRMATIGEEMRIVGGTTPSTKNQAFWEMGTVNFATPKDLASLTSPVLLDTQRCITERGLGEISSGLLPKGVLLLSSRAPIGYLAISEIPVAINQGFIGMICDGALNNLFMLHWLQRNMDVVINNANGTTFLEINKRDFRRIGLVVPPAHALHGFTTIVAPLYSIIVNNMRESRHLMSIRDSLLPRLMSRKIKIEHLPASKRIQSVRAANENNAPNQKTLAELPY